MLRHNVELADQSSTESWFIWSVVLTQMAAKVDGEIYAAIEGEAVLRGTNTLVC